MCEFIKVIAIDRFTYGGMVYQAGCIYDMDKELAKTLAANGRVKHYAGSGSCINSPIKKTPTPTFSINVKPAQNTGIFR